MNDPRTYIHKTSNILIIYIYTGRIEIKNRVQTNRHETYKEKKKPSLMTRTTRVYAW